MWHSSFTIITLSVTWRPWYLIWFIWFAFISAKFNYVLSHVLHISGGTTWLAEVTLQGRPLRLISSVNILQAVPIRRCSWSPDLHIWREKILWSGEYLSIANSESRIPAVSSHCEVVRRVGQGEFREIELVRLAQGLQGRQPCNSLAQLTLFLIDPPTPNSQGQR